MKYVNVKSSNLNTMFKKASIFNYLSLFVYNNKMYICGISKSDIHMIASIKSKSICLNYTDEYTLSANDLQNMQFSDECTQVVFDDDRHLIEFKNNNCKKIVKCEITQDAYFLKKMYLLETHKEILEIDYKSFSKYAKYCKKFTDKKSGFDEMIFDLKNNKIWAHNGVSAIKINNINFCKSINTDIIRLPFEAINLHNKLKSKDAKIVNFSYNHDKNTVVIDWNDGEITYNILCDCKIKNNIFILTKLNDIFNSCIMNLTRTNCKEFTNILDRYNNKYIALAENSEKLVIAYKDYSCQAVEKISNNCNESDYFETFDPKLLKNVCKIFEKNNIILKASKNVLMIQSDEYENIAAIVLAVHVNNCVRNDLLKTVKDYQEFN